MELNPFEIKAEIQRVITTLQNVKDFENYEVHYRTLDSQSDKNVITKLLFKEINNPNPELIKFLLLRYCPSDELSEKLWGIIKNKLTSNQAKIFALDLLRDIDTDWSYEECNKYLDNPDEFVNSDTEKILNKAIINPEVQIDFMDFLATLPENDKIVLLNSLANDYSKDELANMVIPVFLSMPESEAGKTALDILGNSKSQLAYHALNSALDYVDESVKPSIKRNLAILKMAGIREDNSFEYYKELLSESEPYKFCITYPDGHGNQAIIVSRINKNTGRVRFVAIVVDDYKGIKDCFGFNDISVFECNAIIDRFYRGQRALEVPPEILKGLLDNAEKLSKRNLSYEYVCWKNILSDIEPEEIKLDYKVKELSKGDFESILQADFTDFWFLDGNYSDEFAEFLELANNTNPKDFDKIIDENIEKVFFEDEYKVWTDRILNTSVLKTLSGDIEMAENLFALYHDKKLVREFFKNILRKSLYEYYFSKKDEEAVKKIEDMWVNV